MRAEDLGETTVEGPALVGQPELVEATVVHAPRTTHEPARLERVGERDQPARLQPEPICDQTLLYAVAVKRLAGVNGICKMVYSGVTPAQVRPPGLKETGSWNGTPLSLLAR